VQFSDRVIHHVLVRILPRTVAIDAAAGAVKDPRPVAGVAARDAALRVDEAVQLTERIVDRVVVPVLPVAGPVDATAGAIELPYRAPPVSGRGSTSCTVDVHDAARVVRVP